MTQHSVTVHRRWIEERSANQWNMQTWQIHSDYGSNMLSWIRRRITYLTLGS